MKDLSDSRILIVDDTRANLDVLVGALQDRYRLSIALSGEGALRIIQNNPPDLILLDIMMPGMDGYEVCRRLKADPATREIPVMFLTALDQVQNKTTAFEVGGADYVTKPFEILEVRARVESLLRAKAFTDAMVDYQRRLEIAVARRTAELSDARDQIGKELHDAVLRLALAAALRLRESGASVLRFGHGAAAIAARMGLPEESCQTLRYTAPLRDLGMLRMPDQILLKPGALDEEEWEIVRRHPVIGARVLEHSRSPLLQAGCTLALAHHERWDGSGYPKGLKGSAIPLFGRITALVDSYHALTSPRPYRGPFTHPEAVERIAAARGTQFDPAVVDAFLQVAGQCAGLRERYPDEEDETLFRQFGEDREEPLLEQVLLQRTRPREQGMPDVQERRDP
jgi:putative two-component system response regulator